MLALDRQKPVFWGLAVLASLTFWLFPHPPMADLPQHAAQIAALRDSLRGYFRWQNLVELHLLTPYLLGYWPGAVLALVLPVHVVLSLLLTGAFLGFIAGCRLLRQRFGGDERLDCLFIPAFFSFAWNWGMLTYLLATPFLLFFLNTAVTYAREPSGGKGGRLALAGIALFFAHGMTSIFGCLFGGAFLLWQQRHVGRTLRLSWPVFPVAALFLFFVWLGKGDAQLETPLVWGLSVWRLGGLGLIFLRGDFAPFSVSDMVQAALLCAMMVLPCSLARFRLRAEPERGVFILVLLALWMLVPDHFLGTGLIYERLAMFILPFYLLLFAPKPGISGTELKLMLVLPALFCLAFLTLHVVRLEKFRQAEREYLAVISQIEPGQRVLYLSYSTVAPGITGFSSFKHHLLWYQVEQGGWVDFNFAYYLPQVIRFRPEIRRSFTDDAFVQMLASFDWNRDGGRRYRYIIQRVELGESEVVSASRLKNDECTVSLKAEQGQWRVYEVRDCNQ